MSDTMNVLYEITAGCCGLLLVLAAIASVSISPPTGLLISTGSLRSVNNISVFVLLT